MLILLNDLLEPYAVKVASTVLRGERVSNNPNLPDEDHNNLPLLNKNAAMVAQFSTDKKELETALGWSKHTLDNDPGNAGYQATYDALKAKIAGN